MPAWKVAQQILVCHVGFVPDPSQLETLAANPEWPAVIDVLNRDTLNRMSLAQGRGEVIALERRINELRSVTSGVKPAVLQILTARRDALRSAKYVSDPSPKLQAYDAEQQRLPVLSLGKEYWFRMNPETAKVLQDNWHAVQVREPYQDDEQHQRVLTLSPSNYPLPGIAREAAEAGRPLPVGLVAEAALSSSGRGPLRLGSAVVQAKLIQQPKPVYPPLAQAARVTGTVEFLALIGKDGRVQSLQLMSGPPLLVQSAMQAVQQWQYQPTLLNGEPVDVVTVIDINYTLSQ